MCNVEAFFLSVACFFFAKKIDQGGTLLAALVFVLYLFLRLPSILVALTLIFLWAGANAIAHVFMQAYTLTHDNQRMWFGTGSYFFLKKL